MQNPDSMLPFHTQGVWETKTEEKQRATRASIKNGDETGGLWRMALPQTKGNQDKRQAKKEEDK